MIEDFGFQKIMWVFSGRRGLHGWVYDPELMNLKSNQRSALLSYLDLPVSSDGSGRRSISNLSHRYAERLVKLASVAFDEIILNDQRLFKSKEFRTKFIKMIPNEGSLLHMV